MKAKMILTAVIILLLSVGISNKTYAHHRWCGHRCGYGAVRVYYAPAPVIIRRGGYYGNCRRAHYSGHYNRGYHYRHHYAPHRW